MMLTPSVSSQPRPERGRVGLDEAEHRIANHLALIAGLVRLRAADLARPEATAIDAQDILFRLSAQIDAVAALHRTLVGSPGSEMELGDYLGAMLRPLARALAMTDVSMFVAKGLRLPPDMLLPIGQIVAETVTNAVKHGGTTPAVAVHAWRWKTTLSLTVEDRGEGLGGDPATVSGGAGFQLVHTLVDRLGGAAAFEDARPGLRFRLTLPFAFATPHGRSSPPGRRSPPPRRTGPR